VHWLIQKKFGKDPKVDKLIRDLNKFEIPISYCRVIPFSTDGIEFESDEPDPKKKIFTYGSYTLAIIAKKYYNPASFISDKLNMKWMFKHFGNEMLNNDMIFSTIGTTVLPNSESFIRPVEDSKAFTGQIMTGDDFYEWKCKLLTIGTEGYATIDLNTEIVYAPYKPIHQEVRCFIINSKVITYSQYKLGGEYKPSPTVDEYIIDYVKDVIKIWEPEKAYCLDIAIIDGIPKILEANCINASGLYEIDTQKFIMAVEEL